MKKMFLIVLLFSSLFSYQIKKAVIVPSGEITGSANYWCGSALSQFSTGKVTSSGYIAFIGFWGPKGYKTDIEESVYQKVFPLKLYQNIPNPSAGPTTIPFSLPSKRKISILIYDVTGKVVKRLISEKEMDSGFYKIKWNLDDERGEKVPAGVYFYRLYTQNHRETKKMVIFKRGRINTR